MHEKYGSTIRGICEHGEPRGVTFLDYYNDVYPSIDMSLLRKYSMNHGVSSIQTGYSSNTDAMRKCLDALHDLHCPVVIASNSPVFHVKRVLTRLGLSNLNVAAYLTPERRGGITKCEASFWDPLFDLFPKDKHICCLIDDNGLNVQLVRTLGMRALRITPRMRLPESIVHFLDILPSHPTERNDTKPEDEPWFDFDDAAYLEAKNAVDDQSFSASVRADLVQALQRRLGDKINQPVIIGNVDNNNGAGGQKDIVLTVIDVGAGLLNMFRHIQQIVTDAMSKLATADGVKVRLQYVAFESNRQLFPIIEQKMLQQYGMSPLQLPKSADLETADSSTMVRSYHGKLSAQLEAVVHVSAADFMSNDALRTLTQLLATGATTANGESSNKRRFLQIAGDNGAEPSYLEVKSLPVDLIVGCCVADLVPPSALAAQLLEMAGDDGPLVYLPITFAGETKLVRPPPDPRLPVSAAGGGGEKGSEDETFLPLPQDADVICAYHAHLQAQGHHLHPDARYPDGLLAALNRYGCSMLSRGDSNWNIPRSKHPHMWRCMIRFLALGTAFSHIKKWDMKGWFASLLDDRTNNDSTFVASNIDLLAVFPHIKESIRTPTERGGDDVQHVRFGAPPAEALRVTPSITAAEALLLPLAHAPITTQSSQQLSQGSANSFSFRRAVEFVGPRSVRVVEEPVPNPGRGQLLLRTLCSLVSTGTELKIFQGDIDSDQPADLSIAGMQDKMAYPLRYGYSLVGEVVAVGPDTVDGEQWLGKRVFSFSPHASFVVVDASSAMLVPPEVSSEDAVFLPSVETAVSLVQSAQPLLGDRVLVVGQGLIGLLTGAVLQQLTHASDVTVADVSERRLAVASSFNPTSTIWNPSSSSVKGTASVAVVPPHPFDISIEVTGNPKGLQTAIDHTGAYGKVVVGSLFSEGLSSLRLGLKFHRSGVRLITSQVSNIPPEHSGRWNKQRRFDVAWKVLERIRPSRLLPSAAVALRSEDVLQAYLSLERGDAVTVLFKDTTE